MSLEAKTILVMAGGTGGHVFPALAVAEKLLAEGVRVEWLGTRAGIEAELVEKAGIPITYINVKGLRGKGKLGLLLAPFKLLYALMQAASAVLKVKPACVLGMGGFASGPGGMAAWLFRKPLVIHEQNAIAGMTNRLLYRLADVVLEAFPNAFNKVGKAQCVGNPLRESVIQLAALDNAAKQPAPKLNLLVLGGSLGAMALNETVPNALALLAEDARPQVRHQAGRRNYDATLNLYQQAGVDAQVEAFIDDMDAAYGWADVIVCRSGALTVSEVACAGLPSILVPYPYAVDDHQTANAGFLEQAGAAVIVPQTELSAEKLADLLTGPLSDAETVNKMGNSARAVAQLDAAEKVAQHCMEFCYA